MDLGDVKTGLAYNRWANRRLLEAARALPEQELNREPAAASVRSGARCGMSRGERSAG
jgi:hypothetical protein